MLIFVQIFIASLIPLQKKEHLMATQTRIFVRSLSSFHFQNYDTNHEANQTFILYLNLGKFDGNEFGI